MGYNTANSDRDYGDGWGLVAPAAFKAVARRAERLGCVRFARISATSSLGYLSQTPQNKTALAHCFLGLCFLLGQKELYEHVHAGMLDFFQETIRFVQ